MKIIHCADIHADSRMGSHFSREQAEKRRNEVADTFERMVTYARENKVRAIIIAGDFFDTKESQQKRIKNRIGFIIKENPEIDFLYLRGNHDEDTSFPVEGAYDNLKFFSKDGWTKYSYENTDIYGHELGDSVTAAVYNTLVADAGRVNIAVLHGQVADYSTKEGAPVISLPRLVNKNIDYLALGHIHEHRLEKLDSRGKWCYPGCLEGRGFDEAGEKGFVVLDIDGANVTPQFVPFSKRIIHDVEIPLSGTLSYDEISHQIAAGIAGIPSGDIVQVTLTGEITEDTDIETDSYQAAFSPQYFFIRFKDRTEIKIDWTQYENDVSLKGEFIRLVKAQNDLSEQEKKTIIMTGIKALAGRLN